MKHLIKKLTEAELQKAENNLKSDGLELLGKIVQRCLRPQEAVQKYYECLKQYTRKLYNYVLDAEKDFELKLNNFNSKKIGFDKQDTLF